MKKHQEEEVLLASKDIAVEISTFCGSDCIMCPRHSYGYPFEHIEINLFKKILDEAVELGVLSLNTCGFGDVFMDPNLEEKFRYAKEKYPFLKIFVSSTCHLVNKKNIHLINYIDTFKISIYGTTKEVYEKIIENIEYLLSLPKTQRPYVIMSFLVLPENKHQIEEWKRLWEPRADETDLICNKCDQIYDRSWALLYSSNKNRQVGVLTNQPDLITNVLK